MFSYEERIKAVKLLIQYDMCYADVVRELGYPSKGSLRDWYREYKESDDLHNDYIRKYKYSSEQKRLAVTYYLEHGKSVSRTVRNLGFPSCPQLDKWIAEIVPNQKKHCCLGRAVVKYTREQKVQAVISLCSRSKSAKEVAADYGITRENLYNWKSQLLKEGCVKSMTTNNKAPNKSKKKQYIESEESKLNAEKDNLEQQVADLQKEVQRLKIERDIYEKTAFNESSSRYGYRRVHSVITSAGTAVSEKVVRQIMKQDNLIVPNIKRKTYAFYVQERMFT